MVELGIVYGYCLAPDGQAALLDHSFANAIDFVDEFLVVCGLRPVLVDRLRYRELVAVTQKGLSTDDGAI